jgi:hypothetical protein
MQKIEQFLCCPAHSLVTILTEQLQLPYLLLTGLFTTSVAKFLCEQKKIGSGLVTLSVQDTHMKENQEIYLKCQIWTV